MTVVMTEFCFYNNGLPQKGDVRYQNIILVPQNILSEISIRKTSFDIVCTPTTLI